MQSFLEEILSGGIHGIQFSFASTSCCPGGGAGVASATGKIHTPTMTLENAAMPALRSRPEPLRAAHSAPHIKT
jgi:hypothetical protein